jgi:regulator of sirC expression with transglutaminase-like and TPR domain
MTYKGGNVDLGKLLIILAHEILSRKGVNYLTQLNLKKLCGLNLCKVYFN